MSGSATPEQSGRSSEPAVPQRATDPFGRNVIALFGLPFDVDDLNATADRVLRAARQRSRLFLSTVNLDWLVQAGRDPAFRQSALDSDHVTMDGVPVVQLARMAGCDRAVKVAGSDLFDRLRGEDLSVFFFGGRDGAAERATEALAAAGGPMTPAGWHNPGFGDVTAMSADAHLAPVNGSGADLLVVSLGAVKGQSWLMANEAALVPPVVTHLGAVVDFTAGTVERAPRALQVTGFEWAWRIGQDPALWRRYRADFAALPRLVGTARKIRRTIEDLREGASDPIVERQDDGLMLRGAVDADALRPHLRDALAAKMPLRITLADDAAPDLRALGQLALAQANFARSGIGYELCTRNERMAWLTANTVGAAPRPHRGL